jgi:uncharacterized protein YbaP (TraB family)
MSLSRFFSRSCRLVLASLATALVAPAFAADEPQHPAKPLLWKIEGEGVKKPAYLFGTIHVGTGPAATLHPAAEKAFAEATAVHTEAPFDTDTQVGAVQLVMRRDGKQLSDSIGKELSARLDEELKLINPQLNSVPFESLKTWYVAIMLPMLPFQLEGGKPLDMALWDRAAKAGKKTAGMQTTAEQLAGFRDFDEREQVVLLEETLRLLKKDRDEGKDSTKDLVDAYVSGDVDKIEAECEKSLKATSEGEHKELGERLIKRLLTDRDVIMADYIDAALKKSPDEVHFFAAGAAHYTGKNGVRAHLAKKGYTVTRMEP